MEGERIDRRKLMDDTKLARLAKAREKKEELRLKREADKLDLLKKKVVQEMGQQEVDSAEKARLKEEKWSRRKAELLEELKNISVSPPAPAKSVKQSGKVSRSTTATKPPKKPLKHVEPDSEDSEDSEASDVADKGEEWFQLFWNYFIGSVYRE